MQISKTAMIAVYGVIAASLILFTPTAHADPADTGAYVGGGLVLGHHNLGIVGDPGTGVWGGYRFSKYLAAEGQLQWIPGFNIEDIHANDFTMSYSANVKLFWPLGKFQPNLLVGLGAATVDFKSPAPKMKKDETAVTLRIGAGLDYYLTDHIDLVATWNFLVPEGDLRGDSFHTTTFGAQYRF
jgi:opacity protein-like surface antigen